MKKAQKLFSVLLTLMLAFAMAIPAFAAGEVPTGTITINSAANVSVEGKVFKAYKILDAQAVDSSDINQGVIYSVPAEMADFFSAYGSTMNEILDKLNGTEIDLNQFAKDALAAAKSANVTPASATGTEGATSIEIKDIPFGYYVIEDASTSTPVVALMLRTTEQEVTLKLDKPTIEKKIDGDKDTVSSTTGLVDYNNAAISEIVPYVLTSAVPNMVSFSSYTYTVTDTFSAGLAYNADSLVITIGAKTLAKDTDYTVDVTANGDGTTTVEIDFINFIQYKANDGETIKIEYTATVDTDAVIGEIGNANTVNLTYSNNPDDASSTETTPDDVVYTYVTKLVVTKTDEDGNALAGATFELRDADDNVIASATTTAEEGGNVLTFTGLKEGTYTLVETVVPEGYNKADDITFTIECDYPESGTDCTWSTTSTTVTYNTTAKQFETTVVNNFGSLLPETGGIGTTIFYIVGGLLVVGAVVLLITKKRMSAETSK